MWFGASFYFRSGLLHLLRFKGGDVQVFATGGEVEFHKDVAGLMNKSVSTSIEARAFIRYERIGRPTFARCGSGSPDEVRLALKVCE